MTITLDLQPEIEQGLLARAAARGVSLTEYIQGIVAQDVGADASAKGPGLFTEARATHAANLLELFEPIRGLLTDEEVDTLFSRNPSTGRHVDLA